MDDAASNSGGAKADYSAWRERMREKSARKRDVIDLDAKTNDGPRSTSWTADDLFRDSGRATKNHGREPRGRHVTDDHLAVLDLREGASSDEILTSYRNLAKLHHPDRWAGADDETRRHHEACMIAVNAAYQALRSRQRT